jgi:hypothetical protein
MNNYQDSSLLTAAFMTQGRTRYNAERTYISEQYMKLREKVKHLVAQISSC